jgi:16S rRNA processing protein RimM
MMVLAMARQAMTAGTAGTETQVCVAAIAAAHGVQGLVRLKSFTTVAADCIAYGGLSTEDGRRCFMPKLIGMHKGQLLVRFDGIDSRTQAEALRGIRLYVPRAALPPIDDDEVFYHADLIGLAAVLADGSVLGTVRAVFDFGAGDSLEIVRATDDARVLIPFTRAAVPKIDRNAGMLTVVPPDGLLDGPEAPDAEAGGAEPGSFEPEADRPAGAP